MEIQSPMYELIIPSIHTHCMIAEDYRLALEELWAEAMDESNDAFALAAFDEIASSLSTDYMLETIAEVIKQRNSLTNQMNSFYVNEYYTIDLCSEEELLAYYS